MMTYQATATNAWFTVRRKGETEAEARTNALAAAVKFTGLETGWIVTVEKVEESKK
jgi:hypothetical protein